MTRRHLFWLATGFIAAMRGLSTRPAIAAPAVSGSHDFPMACIDRKARDIAQMRVHLIRKAGDGSWRPAWAPHVSRLLKEPNRCQTTAQFIYQWVGSKEITGNTYVFKMRDERRNIRELVMLDPRFVRPLVSSEGAVFYECLSMSGAYPSRIVPASEIIHDRHNCLFHPLVGLSAPTACAYAQRGMAAFRATDAWKRFLQWMPGTLLDIDTALIAPHWTPDVIGYLPPLHVGEVDRDVIRRMSWAHDAVCAVYRVEPHMLVAGASMTVGSPYWQGLRMHMEAIENCLDDSLGLATTSSRPFAVSMTPNFV